MVSEENMKHYFVRFIITLLVFLLLDGIWLGFLASGLYKEYLGYLIASQTNFIAAGLFYLIYIFGLLWFVIDPNLKSKSANFVFLQGALLGLIAYSTYELTNWAVIKDWPWPIVFIDIAWGALLTGTVAVIAYKIFKR